MIKISLYHIGKRTEAGERLKNIEIILNSTQNYKSSHRPCPQGNSAQATIPEEA